MRHVILSVLILALVLTFCIVSSSTVSRACNDTLHLLRAAQHEAAAGQMHAALTLLRGAEQQWRQHEHFFGVVLRHDEIDDVVKNFSAARQYALTRDLDEFLAVCASLSATVEHIRDMTRASYHNILSVPARMCART